MDHSNIIHASLYTPGNNGIWGLPLLFWGAPGVAKTAKIEAVAARSGLICETFALSERGEGAIGAVPVPSSGSDDYTYLATLSARMAAFIKGGAAPDAALQAAMCETPRAELVLNYPRPDWTSKFIPTGRGLIFVDEITSCPPAIMPALMGLFLAGRIGSYTLPKGVRRMAAANPPELAASGYELPMPLANRMGHLDWPAPSVEAHAQYMLRGSSSASATERVLAEMDEDTGGENAKAQVLTYDAEGEEKRVMKAWAEAWAKAVGLETSYLQSRTSAKNIMPKVGEAAAGRAWPSDRTWEMATRAYASSIVHGLSEAEQELFVEAYIGVGAAGEWFTFIKEQDLPNTAALLDGKITFKHDTARADRTVAVLQSCTALIAPINAEKRDVRSAALWQIMENLSTDKADLDLLVPTAHALIESNLFGLKHAARTLARLNPVLKAAGIAPKGAR